MYAKISNRETTAEKVPLYLALLNGMQSAKNVSELRKYKDSLLRSYHPDCNEGSEVTLCLNPTEWVHASRVISAILSSATQPEIIVEIIETSATCAKYKALHSLVEMTQAPCSVN
jgi:hypothetical protein